MCKYLSRVQVVTSVTSSRHPALLNQVSTSYDPSDLFSIGTNPSPGLPDLGKLGMNYEITPRGHNADTISVTIFFTEAGFWRNVWGGGRFLKELLL